MCGVTMALGALRSGLSGRIGSTSNTSKAAPRSLPLARAAATADSEAMPPRAVFTRIAPSFIVPMLSALIRLAVSGVSAQCSETMSDCAISSATGTRATPSSASSSAVSGVGLL